MRLSAKEAERELETAEKIVSSFTLPKGILDVTIQPGLDTDGDPVLWVWFQAEEPDRYDLQRARDYLPFLNDVEDKLYAELDDFRPQVGIR